MRRVFTNFLSPRKVRATVSNSLKALVQHRRNVALVVGTYLLELFGVAARAIVVFLIGLLLSAILWVFGLVSIIFGGEGGATSEGIVSPAVAVAFLSGSIILQVLAVLFVIGPPLFSLLTLFFYRRGGGTYTRLVLGARTTTENERRRISRALATVLQRAPAGTIEPSYIYVLPASPGAFNAFTIGHTVYLTSALVRSDEWLAPLLAREIGNLNFGNGTLTRAMRYLVLFPAYWFTGSTGQTAPGTALRRTDSSTRLQLPRVQNAEGCLVSSLTALLSFILSLTIGGFGLFLLNPFWMWFWRARVFEVDRFAFACGQGAGLIDYLQYHQHLDVATPFFLSSLPYSDERIDRLEELREIGGVLPETLRPTSKLVVRGVGAAYLALIAALLMFLVGRPMVRRAAIALGPSPDGVWQLTQFTRDGDALPLILASERGITTTLVLEGGVATVVERNTSTQGRYTKVGYDDVEFRLSSGTLNFGNRPYRMEKSDDTLTLQGNNQVFEFRQLNDEEVVALTPTTTPTALPVAQLKQAIVGRWEFLDGGGVLQFNQDGGLIYGGFTGVYRFRQEDVVEIEIQNAQTQVYVVEVRGTTLTLKRNQNDLSGQQLRAVPPLPTATPNPTVTSRPTATSRPNAAVAPTVVTTPTADERTERPIPTNTRERTERPIPTNTPELVVVEPVTPEPVISSPPEETTTASTLRPLIERVAGVWRLVGSEETLELQPHGVYVANGQAEPFRLRQEGDNQGVILFSGDATEYTVALFGEDSLLLIDKSTGLRSDYERVR